MKRLKLKFFFSKTCPKCPPAKLLMQEVREKDFYEVEEFDVGESCGLAEAQMYMVKGTPSIVMTDIDEEEVNSWRDRVPTYEELLA